MSTQKTPWYLAQKGKAGVKVKNSELLRLGLELPFPSPENVEMILRKVDIKNKISDIKIRIEQEVGILCELYHLSYLDSVPMDETSQLRDYNVVHRGTLRINVWRMWQELLKAALTGNIKDCFACSRSIAGTSDWSKYCAWVALYIAAHQGHHNLVAELLKRTSLAINYQSSHGWTALHAAARMGRWKVLCMLIDNGADVRIADKDEATAQDLAKAHGHKKCENSLRFCQWNLQKHSLVQKRRLDYDALQERQLMTRLEHQMVDSTQASAFRGTQGQIYQARAQNPVTVGKVKAFQEKKALNPSAKEQLLEKIEEDITCKDEHGKLNFNYGWFDEVRAQRLIPSTRDIIRYSDPSSCQLRPRSLLNPGGYKVSLYSPPPQPANLMSAQQRGRSYTPSQAIPPLTIAAGSSNALKATLPHHIRSHSQPIGKVGGTQALHGKHGPRGLGSR